MKKLLVVVDCYSQKDLICDGALGCETGAFHIEPVIVNKDEKE